MRSPSWCQKLGAATLVLAGCLCLAGAATPPDKGDKVGKVSQENFTKIKNDMAEKDVIGLLGKPGKSSEQDLPGGGKVKLSLWNSGGEVVAVTFKDGKTIVKIGTFAPPGGVVDAIVKEQKAINEELKNAKGNVDKLKAAQAKLIQLSTKIRKLTDAQRKEFMEKMLKGGFGDLKMP